MAVCGHSGKAARPSKRDGHPPPRTRRLKAASTRAVPPPPSPDVPLLAEPSAASPGGWPRGPGQHKQARCPREPVMAASGPSCHRPPGMPTAP
jgi:hypothetical protein